MTYRLAIFDFDGTLADSFPFFAGVLGGLARQHGFKAIEPERIDAFRHLDARQLMEHVGLPAWKLPAVARSFTALVQQGAESIPLFPGIEASLLHLAQAGVRLAIVSSNARENVCRILGPRNAALFADMECGMSIFGKHSRIRKVLRRTDVPAREAIYVGDQATDAEAARREGLAFGAVAWGYGTLESLRKHAPEEVFESVEALKGIAQQDSQGT